MSNKKKNDDNNYDHNHNYNNNQEVIDNNNSASIGIMSRDDEIDSINTRSGGSENQGGGSGGNDQNLISHNNKRKRYHRHTQFQIQEMEAFFIECPHPDDKQRKELSRQLGLEPLQIKFWFQNKRTQMKNHNDRNENTKLRAENEKLRAENHRCRQAMANATCPHCGGQTAVAEMSLEEHHLQFENTRLRAEIERISAMSGKYVSKPVMNYPVMSPPIPSRPSELGLGTFGGAVNGNGGNLLRSVNGAVVVDKPMIINLAVGAMEEFMRMAEVDQPLWMVAGRNETDLTLNEDEYARLCNKGVGPRLAGSRIEASKETGVVIMNHVNIAEMLMDVNQWSTMFTGMVSNAMTLDVLSGGVTGNVNGTLQLMTAEFQVPFPIASARESCFVRYCKQQGDGLWAVVDVSVDSLHSNIQNRCRRRPSGCLIKEMSNGCSKVTWVEHVEVDDNERSHQFFQQVASHALGAKRWIATLERKCERLASVISTSIPSVEMEMVTNQGKMGMLNLAERMAINFFDGVSTSNTHNWSTLQAAGTDDVKVMMRKTVADPGRPPGIVLSAATSLWFPFPPKKVFDFLRNENYRSQWDVLSNGGVMRKIARITNGIDTRNCISLLRNENSNDNNMLILEEHCTDPTGSSVIYAPVDTTAMNNVLNGGDPDYVALLPSGFYILPDRTAKPAGGANTGDMGEGTGEGSFLTVAFQILVDSLPSSDLTICSVATANNLIACTLEGIKKSLTSETA